MVKKVVRVSVGEFSIHASTSHSSAETTTALNAPLIQKPYPEPTFGVVTALPKEFVAMKAMLDSCRRMPHIPRDNNTYILGEVPALDGTGSHSVVLTLPGERGNNVASVVATNLIRSFHSVDYLLMVGIAGGAPNHHRPSKHVRLGDVVVSDIFGVVQYDNVRIADGKAELRMISQRPSAALINKVNFLEAERLSGDSPWEQHVQRAQHLPRAARPAIPTDKLHTSRPPYRRILQHPTDSDRKPDHPRLHYGRIGSANALLKDAQIRDLLRDELDILAFEMEGSGIADATWIGETGYLVIRGICDYCDTYKNDTWQAYAAVVAAAYARALIESFSTSMPQPFTRFYYPPR